MCLFSTIIFVSLFSGKNALVNVRKIGWIWYFGCNRGWWLLEQKSSTWFRNRTKGPCVYVAQWQAQARVQLSSLQAGPCCMLLARPRHYLTYYVLSSSHCALTSTPAWLRAHKEIACKLSEKFHHTEQRAGQRGQHYNLVKIFSFSDYVKICKNDISRAHGNMRVNLSALMMIC